MFWDGASQPLLDLDGARSRHYFVVQGCSDLKRIGSFGWHWLLSSARGDKEQAVESALSMIQRVGRLRTHSALALRGAAPD
jgi:hypothetical protein